MARRYGLSLRALRFYEDRGLIRPLRHGTARLYDARCRGRLEKVLKAKRLGFTLGRIYEMMPRIESNDSEIEQTLAPAEIVAQIASLERQKNELDTAILALRAAHEKLANGETQATLYG
jgi:DNA-binding transcriptional MerR regulator